VRGAGYPGVALERVDDLRALGPVEKAISITALVLAACGPAASELEPSPAARPLASAAFALSDAPSPPPDVSVWEPVSLPDRWRERRPEAGGFAWYRMEVPGPAAPGAAWALYLPHVNMNAAVYVNGAPVGSGGRFTEPVARNFNRPLYFAFPSDLLGRAGNEVHVRLFVYRELFGELGTPWIGEDRALRPAYEKALWWRTTLAQVATMLCLVTVLFCAALGLGGRGDRVYAWLALVTALWSAVSFNYWLRDVPFAVWTWERIVHGALDLFVLALAAFSHRYVGVRRPRVDRALGGAALLSAGFAVLAPQPLYFSVVNGLHVALFPAAVYGTLVILRHALRTRGVEGAIYLPAGLAALGFACHDILLQLGRLSPGAPHLLPYLVPLMLASFGSTLVLRVAAGLRSAEALNRELEARVEEKHRELESSYAARRALEHANVLAAERERLVREMHDGLGGQLVSLLSLVEGGDGADPRVAGAVRAALDDMRLVIDSLDPALHTLGGALGAARARFEPALAKSGVALEWRAGDLPPTPWLGPQDYLQVLRIVQEALVNVVRHAQARRVAVTTGRRADERGRPGILIEVCDDGCGRPQAAAERAGGRGLRNMRERAERLAGSLRVEAADAATGRGVRVALWLPAPDPPAAASRS
jgi:signal transduction histidine kinase